MNAPARFPTTALTNFESAVTHLRAAAQYLDRGCEKLGLADCNRLRAIKGQADIETLADAIDAFADTLPIERGSLCKNRQRYVRQDGGCLQCDADCGEACRLPAEHQRIEHAATQSHEQEIEHV